MTAYLPGTVADIVLGGKTVRAMHDDEGRWFVATAALGGCHWFEHTNVESVTVRRVAEDGEVVVALTRDDVIEYCGAPGLRLDAMRRVAQAVLDQTPEPEPPKRWEVVRIGRVSNAVRDTFGVVNEPFLFEDLFEARRLADLLNAAEATS